MQIMSKILIMTGMHRSGTSLVAQYLGECGLHVGSSLTSSELETSRNYYGGHHEDQEFQNLHKKILRRKRISEFQTHGFRIPIRRIDNESRKSALKIIQSREHLDQWGWKDPRTTLFLDFWNSVLDNGNFLFLIRKPLSVVDSLLRRGREQRVNKKPINGLRIWKVYNEQILDFYRRNGSSNTLISDADEFVKSPELLNKALVNKFDLNLLDKGLDGIYENKAFRKQNSEQVEMLKSKYPREIKKAEALYDQLLAISNEQIR